MTRISSYTLLQCNGCGQKHILPNYGSINLILGNTPILPNPEDIRVCQRCSEQKPLEEFTNLGMLKTPTRGSSSKWLRFIRSRFFKTNNESELHPSQLYPDLNSTPFDVESYFPETLKKHLEKTNTYPQWYLEFKSKTK